MNTLAAANAAAQHMVDDWSTIDPHDLHPDTLAALRALAFEMRLVIEKEWRIRDDG